MHGTAATRDATTTNRALESRSSLKGRLKEGSRKGRLMEFGMAAD